MASKRPRPIPKTGATAKLTASQRLAAEMFATNDLHNYRIEDIAREVGVSERTKKSLVLLGRTGSSPVSGTTYSDKAFRIVIFWKPFCFVKNFIS